MMKRTHRSTLVVKIDNYGSRIAGYLYNAACAGMVIIISCKLWSNCNCSIVEVCPQQEEGGVLGGQVTVCDVICGGESAICNDKKRLCCIAYFWNCVEMRRRERI